MGIRERNRETHVLRGAKIALFLLSVLFVTVLTSGISARPTKAEFLNTVVSCVLKLNLGTCPPPPADTPPPLPTDETDDPVDDDSDVEPAPDYSDDVTDPVVTVGANPLIAGGTYDTVTITGDISDENLDSYILMVNGERATSGSALTEKTIHIDMSWSVSTPERVASGDYVITLDATDKAGRTAHKEVTVVVDNDGPTKSVTGGNVIIKGGSISPTVTASDAHDPISYSWTGDADNPSGINEYDASASEPIFTPTVEGSYTFYLTLTDGLGNISTDQFDFGYAQQLETVPLPTKGNPIDEVRDETSTTPSIVPTSSNISSRSGRDEVTTSDDGGVLGSTISAPGQVVMRNDSATITATDKGWSIFGVLWYWWLIVFGIIMTVGYVVKKIIISRVPEQS